MKTKPILIALFAALLSGCAKDVERLAQPYLTRAQQHYANKQYSLAKLQLDSIKLLYPKAFETRKQAQDLQLRVEYDEAHAGKLYADSLLADTREKAAAVSAKLYLDKDPAYQDVGHYYASRHRVEQNVGRTFLRPQVSERGECSVVVYNRGKAIQAHTLRFTASDGSFVELKTKEAPHIFSDASGRTERADFVVQPDNNVASFVQLHSRANLKVSLVGEAATVAVPMGKADAESLAQVCELAALLRLADELERQASELERRIHFFEDRLQIEHNTLKS